MKLLKTLKSLKILQKSKLAKAVAMSLIVGSGVMGVCGNASAKYAPVYYSRNWTGSTWTHDISEAYRADVDFTWNKNWDDYVQIYAAVDSGKAYYSAAVVQDNTLTVKDGLIAFAYAGYSASKMEVKKNTLNLKGGTYNYGSGEMCGGKAFDAHCTANTVNVYEGNNISYAAIYGSRTDYGKAGDSVVNLYKGITVDSGVFGGRADHGAAVANTVNVNEGVTVGGTVFGGYFREESVGRNTVNLQKWSHVKGDVNAAITYAPKWKREDRAAYDNTVNVYGYVTVDGKVCGGIAEEVPSRNNTLNVSGENNHFGGLGWFQNINFVGAMGSYGSAEYGYVEMLSVNDAVDINSFDSIKVNANASNSYATNVTLLYSPNSDFTNLDKTKLKLIDQYTNINGQKIVEEVTHIDVDKSRLSKYYKEDDIKDIDAIGAAVSYSVGKHSIGLATYAKLVDTLNVNDDITLDRGMILNDQTINMQDAKDTSADDVKYSTLAVDNILGKGNLKIDVDMSGGKDNIKNDKIYTNREYTINGQTFTHNKFNDATITLDDVIVRKDLPSTLTGMEEEKGEISVVEGDINGITVNVANGKVKTATSNYIYTFTPGEGGKINYTQILPGTISEFIHAEGKYKYVSTLTLTDDEVADKNLDSLLSRFDRNRNITLNFNEGITLSGKKDNTNYEGVKVDLGYTFNLKGETGEKPGKITDFKNYAVKNEGTLNVENITFTNNKTFQGVATDIINESAGVVNFSGTNAAAAITNAGTLNLNGKNNIAEIGNTGTVNTNGQNTITKLINDGTLKLTGTNTVTTLSGVGNTAVETGKTTISDFAQNDVTVNKGAELVVNNKATINGRIENNGKFNATGSSIEAMTNNGDFSAKDSSIVALTNNKTANMNGNNTLTSVSGTGNMNVYGETTVSGNFEQNNAYVDRNKSLTLNGNQNIINRLYVRLGSVDLTNTNSINDIRTLDTRSSKVSLNGTNNIGYIYLISVPGYDKEPLNLNGSNTIESINGRESDDVICNAQIIIEGGKTTVTGSCKLTDVTVDAGKLTLNGYSFVKSSLNINKNGTLEIGDALRLTVAAINNNGIVTMNSTKNNTLPRVEGEGTFNVEAGKTNVSGNFAQNTLVNNSIINLSGKNNKISTVSGTGTFNVQAGTTTVSDAFAQKTLNVSGGELELKAIGDSFAGDSVQVNTVNVSGGTVKGNLAGNTVNLSGGSVTGTVYGGSTVADANNVLNVSGSDIQAGNIANFQELNYTVSKDIKEDVAMLNLKDATATSLEKTTINTNVDNYTLETTVTLLSAPDLTGISTAELKINGNATENKTMMLETAVDGLSEDVGVVVGYDVSEQALKLTTNSYKLLKDTDVTKDVTINKELNLNEQTLNMQSDPEDVAPYNTLTVKKLSGEGKLAIDVDLAAGVNDKINITGEEDNKATINLNSIIVRGELAAEYDEPIDNKVTVLEGKLDGIDLAVGTIKTATSDNIYTFEKGTDAGKLKVTKVAADNIIYFLPGKGTYEDVNTLTLTKDETVIADLGTTDSVKRDNVLTLAFNADKKLSGDNKAHNGAIVDKGYTLKLQGEDAKAPGVMTQFKTAATVEAEGTLEVADMKFVDNGKDIVNNGTLKLSGTNTINDITNDGKAELEGNNAITAVSGTGKFDVEAGETTVSGALIQDTVTVNGGKLALKDATVGRLNVETDAALEVGGNLTISEGFFNNDGIVSLKSNNTITAITGKGTLKVEAEKVAVNSILTQNAVEVKAGSELELNCGTNIGGTLTNAGTVSLNGVNSTVGAMNNTGTVILSGTNDITSALGNGTFNVEKGKTTVSGAFAQKVVNVSDSELELQAPEKSFLSGEVQGHAANITGGKVTGHAYGGLSVEDAHENNVNITNGTVDGDVYGGVSYNGNAYKNTVNISSGTVTGDVYGALAINNGTAYANTVNISGDDTLIKGNVYGGINEYGDNNTHHDNVINISGGTVGGTIYGASNKVEANNLLHVTGSNTKPIEVGNIAYLQKLEFTMPQGYNKDQAILTLTNDKDTSLNLNGDKSVVLNSAPEDRLVTGEKVTLIQKINDQASLDLKDNGNAIFDENGTMKAAYANTALYMASPLYILKGKLELVALADDNIKNDLIFVAGKNILDRDDEEVKPEPKPTPVEPDPDDRPKPEPKPDIKPIVPPSGDDEPQPIIPVDPEPQPDPEPGPKPEVDPEPQPTPEPDPQPQPQPIDYDKLYGELMDNVKTALETRASGAALLNEAGDFLMKQGLSNAKMAAAQSKAEGDSSMAPFAVIGGGNMRYKTGSHVDSKSWHGAVGLAKEVKGLTFGVAIQQGKSNFDTYVNKAHSEGNSKSVGGALFAEKKIASGLHFDAAVRGGRIKNDYKAHIGYTGYGEYDVSYKESSAFYGISLGGGKEFNLKNKDKVDVYGRYAWTHTGSSDATTNWKDDLKFDGINSHRILLGGRYTHAVDDKNELYAGLGWQYELGGKVKGSVYGYSVPEPSLKGSSGLLELGWKAAVEENFAVDLNLSGWTGKQRGAMAGVNMQWKF